MGLCPQWPFQVVMGLCRCPFQVVMGLCWPLISSSDGAVSVSVSDTEMLPVKHACGQLTCQS